MNLNLKSPSKLFFSEMNSTQQFYTLHSRKSISRVNYLSNYYRELLLFFIMGFFGMFINQLMYILGVVYTTPDTASMFQAIIPVLVVIIAVLFRTERFPRVNTKLGAAKIFGILLATGGALLMAYAKQNAKSNGSNTDKNLTKPTWYGYLFLVANISCTAVWVVMQKKYIFNKVTSRFREYPINTTAWTYLSGAICMGFASFYYAERPQEFVISDANVMYCLIYAVFITSALCYMLITWCNMQVNSSFVTACWPLQVLFCAILSYVVLGEVMVALEIVGGLMIIVALLAVTWSNYTEQRLNTASGAGKHSGILSRNSDETAPLLDQ